MTITFEASPSRPFSSSSVTRTYWSFANTVPRTIDARSTTSLQVGQKVCCLIRDPHLALSSWNDTFAEDAAGYILTGMETSPNEIVPEPSECGGMVCTIARCSL